jgi:hypothetical protein
MVSFADFNSRGRHNWVLRDLREARKAFLAIEIGLARPRFVTNITATGQFIGSADGTLHHLLGVLRESGRLFRQGNTLVFIHGCGRPGGGCSPTPIAVDGVVAEVATAIVRNVVMCREWRANSTGKGAKIDQPSEYEVQFPVPKVVLQQIISLDGAMDRIPEVRYIVNHPVFDEDFSWLDTGFHATQKIMVCGDSFAPAELEPIRPGLGGIQTVADVLDRLPPYTRRWVEGFHWRTPIDLVNYIGAALMIPVMPMLVEDGHPGVMFWGNQPGIGKSLAAQCLAILKDGEQASPTSVDGGAREVENQIASELNDGRTAIFIDNQKGSLNIPILEANMTSKEVAIRGFNMQRKIRRPNDIIWLITTNDAAPSDDMLARCIHVWLHFEGQPDGHPFTMTDGELTRFVSQHRSVILAELAGMYVRWLDHGRPRTPSTFRFRVCGGVIGSVLACNGLPGFLSNQGDVRECSSSHQQLIALVERLVDSRDKGFVWEVDCSIEDADDEFKHQGPPTHPQEQKDWVHLLQSAGVVPASCDTPQKQKKAATQYLNSVVKKHVEVEVGKVTVQASMVSRPIGGRRIAYALAVRGIPKDSDIPVKDVAAHPSADEPGRAEFEAGDDGSEKPPREVIPDGEGGLDEPQLDLDQGSGGGLWEM